MSTENNTMSKVNIPLDIDHTCGKGSPGGSLPPFDGPFYVKEIGLERQCPACCYKRGYEDRDREWLKRPSKVKKAS